MFLRVITRRSFKRLSKEDYVKVDVDLKSINDYSIYEDDIGLQLTWFGHAAALLQINGFNILFDPLLSSRASPVPFMGPYRYRKRGFKSFSELPQIDLLIISHNHYDHLDKTTLKEMFKEFKNRKLHIFCPIGLKKWFLKRYNLLKDQITEGDWWDDFEITKIENPSTSENTITSKSISKSISLNEHSMSSSSVMSLLGSMNNEESLITGKKLRISCVPAQHSSRRGLFDGNKSLWCGWAIKSDDASFYFAGDTGYRAIPENCPDEDRSLYPHCPFFTQIGKIYGPFDYACIPIGPSNDSNIATAVHVDSTDAINIHKEIQSKHSIPIHWGTVANFCTIEITHDPNLLRSQMKKSGLPLEEFNIAYIGQVLKLLKKDTYKNKNKNKDKDKNKDENKDTNQEQQQQQQQCELLEQQLLFINKEE
ncbi:Metallo-hydrolase/oxidoreductase [Anaeromyces robustus]|uniref:Metallo-hydrolase/oxidoreductase n=1 Tax=Anaeromyces robustus TaxID=1754192 RepID=A0A1Y1XCV1_9FUNG|nr:Metallo-hydrolase/oxidoreductase [Anaeromyces robustus]|eukprot:ORX83568.1 Metallo-hydrolase/oxidoreductase [Anaeromyces robustus]